MYRENNINNRVTTLEHKTTHLEEVLESFIVHTKEALDRLEKEMREFKREMQDFKDEMRAFKDEMLDFKDEMRAFKDEMKDFKDEMLDFKDEMRAFKDETRHDRKEMNKRWGELSNKMGTVVEDIISPATRPVIIKYFKCDPDFIGVRLQKKKVDDNNNTKREEFDIVATCKDKVILIEVKTTLRPQYIDDFKDKIKRFREFFPEYKEKKLIPILASLSIDSNFLNLLTKEHIYAMAYKEWEYMDILNFEELKNK